MTAHYSIDSPSNMTHMSAYIAIYIMGGRLNIIGGGVLRSHTGVGAPGLRAVELHLHFLSRYRLSIARSTHISICTWLHCSRAAFDCSYI